MWLRHRGRRRNRVEYVIALVRLRFSAMRPLTHSSQACSAIEDVAARGSMACTTMNGGAQQMTEDLRSSASKDKSKEPALQVDGVSSLLTQSNYTHYSQGGEACSPKQRRAP